MSRPLCAAVPTPAARLLRAAAALGATLLLLLGGADASLVEVFQLIGEVTGWPVPTTTAPAWLFRLAGRISAGWAQVSASEPLITPEAAEIVVARARVVSDRAETELGYQPTSLRTMIEDCHGWLLAEGKI